MTASESTLSSWFQTQFSKIYDSNDLDSAFDSVFSSQAKVYMNHKEISRDSFKDDVFVKGRAAAIHISIEWEKIVDTGSGDGEGGIVAGFFVVTRSLKFRIRAAPAQTQSFVTFSAKIEQDPAITSNDSTDRRRVVNMFQTSIEKAVPIHWPKPRASGGDMANVGHDNE